MKNHMLRLKLTTKVRNLVKKGILILTVPIKLSRSTSNQVRMISL